MVFQMTRRIVFVCILFLTFVLQAEAQNSSKAAQALIRRITGNHARNFSTEIIPSSNGKDVFELESRDGKIILRGNSPIAIASALNWYLK